MADEVVDTEQDIDAQLEALEKKLLEEDNEDPDQETVNPAPTTEAPTPEDNDVDLDMAAVSHFSRMPREKQAELLTKHLGYDLTPKEKKAVEEAQLVQGAQSKTAREMVDAITGGVDLPSDFDDLSPSEQAILIANMRAEKLAEEKANQMVAPILQRQAQEQLQQELSATASGWATELGRPDAAEDIFGFMSQFPPEYIEMYKKEATNGGGPLMQMVAQQVRGIVDAKNRADESTTEIQLPKSEEVVPQQDDSYLQGGAKDIYDDLKASGMDEADLRTFRKQLAGVKL